MTGLEGINSLKTTLSSLNVQETAAASSTQSKAGAGAGLDALAAQAGTTDRTSLGAASGLASDTSDVRMTKVAELRQAIASGTYNVPASAVADKIVEGMLR